MSRSRLNVFLEPDHGRRLAQLAGMKGVSKSAIVAAAFSSYLSPDGGDRREAAIAKRLDKLTRQFDRLERDQTILIETVALFVRYTLTVNAPIPAAHQDAARAQGRERFQQFVDQLARHLQKGRSLVKDVHEEIFPDQSRFFGPDGEEEGDARTSSPQRRRRFRRWNGPMSPLRSMPVVPPMPSVASRQIKMLRSAMGAAIASALENPDVVEVLLNPDGTLWVDTLSGGRSDTGLTLSKEDGDRIIRLVAALTRLGQLGRNDRALACPGRGESRDQP